jgi:hypothetical protein
MLRARPIKKEQEVNRGTSDLEQGTPTAGIWLERY